MATWMDLFWDAILGRGMKITFDKITSIEQNADAIVATVVGTEPYTVTIKKDFSEMSCTCPCEGYYCKHMVAVLRFLEQDEKLREILANFADSELGKRAVSFEQQRIAANAKAEEQRAREIERAIKYQEYLKNLPQILKEREEKRKQAEEKKRIAEEKRKERERKLQEEYEAAEKRRKEFAKQERERRKQQKEEAARRQAEFERIQAENAKRFEEEKIAREAEEQKQKNIAELKRLEAEQKAEEAKKIARSNGQPEPTTAPVNNPRLDFNELPKQIVALLPEPHVLVKSFLFAPKPDQFLMGDARRAGTYNWINGLKNQKYLFWMIVLVHSTLRQMQN